MTEQQKRLRIHVISETPFVMKGQGVHTAHVDCVDLLKSKDDVDVAVNGEGWGDVMHSHTYGPYYFWKGRRYRGRRILTVHVIPDSIKGSLPAWKVWMPFVRSYFRQVYSYASVCIAISPVVEDAVRQLTGRSRVVRIANPIIVEKFAPSAERRRAGRKLLGLSDEAFVVLGVGQLESRKGVEEFLDVAAACPELSFVWVGGRPFGVMTDGLITLNRRMAAAGPNVRFAGTFELDRMPFVYNAADLLLFPSYQENSPLAPIEAAAAGLPVIFRDIEEYARLYEHPYLKATSTAEFVAMTKRLAAEPGFHSQGRAISRQLLAQFDKDQIRTRLLELYREVWDARSS